MKEIDVVFHGDPTVGSALSAWSGAYDMWGERRRELHPDANDPKRQQFGITLYIDADELREILEATSAGLAAGGRRYLDRLVVDLRAAHEALERLEQEERSRVRLH